MLLAYVALLIRSVLLYFYATRRVGALSYVITFFEYIAIISAGLAVFNIIPIPPLDGAKVVYAVLPDRAYAKAMVYERYGMILLMVVLFTGALDVPLDFLRGGLLDGLSRAAWFPFRILTNLKV